MKLSDINIHSIGDTIQMVGAVYAGEGKILLCLFPEDRGFSAKTAEIQVLDMDSEDWKKFLRQTDLLETEIMVKAKDGTLTKAMARKSQRQIDQIVSWNVYRRDKYACRYCGNDKIPLTVDHLIRWEEGGPSIEANLLTADKICNKLRGNMSYGNWMRSDEYKSVSGNLDWNVNRQNHEVEFTLDKIPRVVNIKSR